MRAELEGLMSRYGTDMIVTGIWGQAKVRGFFQAVNTKSWQSMESVASPMGAVSGDSICFWGLWVRRFMREIPWLWAAKATFSAGWSPTTIRISLCISGDCA